MRRMAARLLQAHELVTRCDPATLAPEPAGADAAPPDTATDIVGQARARAAVDFGIAMPREGYHLFIMGPAGSGKRSLARRAIDARVAGHGVHRYDWVYVNNFDRPHQPVAIRLGAGQGARLQTDMRALVDELRTTIPAAFESEEYATELERLNTDFKDRAERGLIEVGEAAQRQGLAMIRTPVGFTFAPQKGTEVMSPQEFEALPEAERKRLEQAVNGLQEQLVHALRATMRLRKEHADRLRALNRATTKLAVEHAVDEMKTRYAESPVVCAHLDAVRAAVIDDADAFRPHDDGEGGGHDGALARFEVNLVVDAGGIDGAPIVEADLPTYQNLIGRVDHIAHFGMLVTDFRHIKAGALHRANGGYLLVDALKLLTQPFAWSALKRALLRREIRIEAMAEMFGMVSTVQLEPQPIPLDVKVVLVGERELCLLLQAHDPEFEKLFRVVADLDDDLPRVAATQRALAQTLAGQARSCGLLPPGAPALARLIDHGARRSGDATRIHAGVRHLLDVLHEADHLARAAQRAQIGADDVAAAIAQRRERAGRVDERVREAMLRERLAIATAGSCVGQVNGLAAYQVGDEGFGLPTRITATTRLGDGQVVDIQRETRLGGPVHAKGVLILSSFLAARFSRFDPHSIVGSLVFEQTYGLVEGDSASLAELVALLASIGDIPVRQSLAVTGSVDQFGHVQAVGGVNEKVEGFFDLCAARGLDGSHGVVVPASNVSQLMLRDDIVQSVADRRFALHAVTDVDDAVEVLTGLPAGDAAMRSADTVNGRIAKRLHEYASLRRGEPRFVRRKPLRIHRATPERGGQ
jgi:predicted ATP-dependent protease